MGDLGRRGIINVLLPTAKFVCSLTLLFLADKVWWDGVPRQGGKVMLVTRIGWSFLSKVVTAETHRLSGTPLAILTNQISSSRQTQTPRDRRTESHGS